MGVGSERSRVADLAFQVFGRTVHPDWFAVRGHRRIARDSWDADVRIIEGGHAIHWRCGPIRLTEVLAGPKTPLPEPGMLFHAALRPPGSTLLRPGTGVEYQSCFEVERNDPEVFQHQCDEIVLDAAWDGLFHRCASTNRLAPPPISHLRIEARARGLLVHAFHSFPDEWAIVRVQSLFEIDAALLRNASRR